MWSKQYPACIECKKTELPYYARGMCKRCYDRAWSPGATSTEKASLRKRRMMKRRADFYALQARRKETLRRIHEYVERGEHLVPADNKTAFRTETREYYIPSPHPETMFYEIQEFRKLLP